MKEKMPKRAAWKKKDKSKLYFIYCVWKTKHAPC